MSNVPVSSSVEQRLLQAGKRLFASQGFENATTSGIAREAGTSESQLVKYFGSKEGLLQKIFEDGWLKLNFVYTAASVSNSPVESLRMIFELLVKMLSQDRELRDLMLFEGRRIRGKNSEVLLTAGYYKLYDEVTRILQVLMKDTQLGRNIRPQVLSGALIGMLESMLRDQAMAERKTGKPDPSPDEIRAMFHLFTSSLFEPSIARVA
ncbi:MAG: TetR/AcrR family transcriptional regulator [Acidobacteriaceae bacterium]|nr:TetR/AcrR family transcriptional regulator [Acidobacteriaceae bacterium]